MVYKSKVELQEAIDNLKDSDIFQETQSKAVLLNTKLPYIIVFKEVIGGDYDYIDVEYDKSEDILYGRPCVVNVDDTIRENGLIWTLGDIELVKEIQINTENLHEWFDGLETDSFIDIQYEDLNIPLFIKDLKINSFNGCKCIRHLSLPTHLIKCFVASGLRVDGNIDLIGTGSFGSLGKACGEYIEYKNFFDIGKHLQVYKDSLSVNNKVFLEDFIWEKFYNSVEEMAVCLLLAKMKVFVNSDVTLAIWDFYKEFEN